MLYGDIIDVRRRDAVTAGDTHLVTFCDLELANGVDGNPLAADDARTQASSNSAGVSPTARPRTRPCSRARATSTTCLGPRSGRRHNKPPLCSDTPRSLAPEPTLFQTSTTNPGSNSCPSTWLYPPGLHTTRVSPSRSSTRSCMCPWTQSGG